MVLILRVKYISIKWDI